MQVLRVLSDDAPQSRAATAATFTASSTTAAEARVTSPVCTPRAGSKTGAAPCRAVVGAPAADPVSDRVHVDQLSTSFDHSTSWGASSGQRSNSFPFTWWSAERSIHSRSPHGGSTSRVFGSSAAISSDVARVW